MSCLEVTNDSNLHAFNNNYKKGVWFVWFYAEWCGHCKSMEEPWDNLKNNNVNKVSLAKVRDDYIPKLEHAPPVQGYPTIMLYKNGEVAGLYQGQRTEDGFNNYLNSNVSPKDLVNTDANTVESMSNDSGIEISNIVELKTPKKPTGKKASSKKAKGAKGPKATVKSKAKGKKAKAKGKKAKGKGKKTKVKGKKAKAKGKKTNKVAK